jgi:rSAM/selenodomain-associated transferase 2
MISVVIPVYNEEGIIGNTIRYLRAVSEPDKIKEIIVVDGGSWDNSANEAKEEGALVILSSRKGRAAQMNEGARAANAPILYFLHADSIPPAGFTTDITEAINNGYAMGCYRLRFDLDHWFLKANTWFTRFNIDAFRYGDQSLFVTREVFLKAGGFSEKHIVMEDHEIIKRLRKYGNFIIVPKHVITSARKYVTNGIYKMQGIFYLMYLLYQLGYSQDKLLAMFRKLVKQDKL